MKPNAIPGGLHNDWPWPFSLIPRKATAIPGSPDGYAAGTFRYDYVDHYYEIGTIRIKRLQ